MMHDAEVTIELFAQALGEPSLHVEARDLVLVLVRHKLEQGASHRIRDALRAKRSLGLPHALDQR